MENSWNTVKAEFLQGATDPLTTLNLGLPCVAIVGRSNAGKSSLVNRLCNQKKLARVSGTPGRTQEINYFKVTLKRKLSGEVFEFILADLPGFGFAKFSKEQRERTASMIIQFIRDNQEVDMVLLLNDSKRTPEADEAAVRNECFKREKHLLVIATKCDRLNQSERAKNIKALATGFGLQAEDLFSSGEKMPVAPILERLVALLSL